MAKILIVDDSQAHLFNLKKIVEDNGHQAITAESGELGLERATSELPDLILMDIVMPGMNGFQVTRKISRNAATKNIPVIFVTTKNLETDRIWGLRQGAAAYITKPVDEKALVTAIDSALT